MEHKIHKIYPVLILLLFLYIATIMSINLYNNNEIIKQGTNSLIQQAKERDERAFPYLVDRRTQLLILFNNTRSFRTNENYYDYDNHLTDTRETRLAVEREINDILDDASITSSKVVFNEDEFQRYIDYLLKEEVSV